MPATVPDRWTPVGGPFARHKVEIWSMGRQVAEVSEVLGGSVKETRATGIRATLALTVEPTGQWLRWLNLPRLELRPWAGYSWGESEHLLPLGRFPVDVPALSLPAQTISQTISLTASDYWGWGMMGDAFRRPMNARRGLIRDSARWLMDQSRWAMIAKLDPTIITATSEERVPDVVWQGSKHTVIADLVESIGAEAFVTREGTPVIQDRDAAPGGPPLTDRIVDPAHGSIISITKTSDMAGVFNTIIASTTNQDASFDPALAQILDRRHPAHRDRIGPRVKEISSPNYRNYWQALKSAQRYLAKVSEPALGWQVEAMPDPSRMAGDLVPVATNEWGSADTVILDVTHDLTGASMKMSLGAV